MKSNSSLSIEKNVIKWEKIYFYNCKKVFWLRKFCFFIRKSIKIFWLSGFASYLLKYKKVPFPEIYETFQEWVSESYFPKHKTVFKFSVSYNMRSFFGIPFSRNIRKVFFCENIRSIFRVSVSWNIIKFLTLELENSISRKCQKFSGGRFFIFFKLEPKSPPVTSIIYYLITARFNLVVSWN